MMKQYSNVKENIDEASTKGMRARCSTACEVKFPMWVMHVKKLLELYEDGDSVLDVHQVLQKKGVLVDQSTLSASSTVIFVSHEWLGWLHPDPKGVQLRVLVKVLGRLLRGEIKRTDMNGVHELGYGHSFTFRSNDWKRTLRDAYIWIDWISIPQPVVEDKHSVQYALTRETGKKAVESIPGYVESSSFMLILCPPSTHADRKDMDRSGSKKKIPAATCYRTWRQRGWCVAELFACFFSRRKKLPTLLVRSENGKPEWISTLECLKLSPGSAHFTCCDRNHTITTATQEAMVNDDDVDDDTYIGGHTTKKISCDRPIVRSIMTRLMVKSANRMFDRGECTLARLSMGLRRHWLKGLYTSSSDSHLEDFFDGEVSTTPDLTSLKRYLRWNESKGDKAWFDKGGVSILHYGILTHNISAVRELLVSLPKSMSRQRRRLLESRLPQKGFLSLGIPGGCTSLMNAVSFSTPAIVELLLKAGADPYAKSSIGGDCVNYIGVFNRSNALSNWCRRFSDWDFNNRRDNIAGGLAISSAAYMGQNKVEIVRSLIAHGADPKATDYRGSSLLHCICDNDDADLDLLHYLLSDKVRDTTLDVNYKRRSISLKFKMITYAFSCLHKWGLSRSALVTLFAHEAGDTPLICAVRRGDLRAVEILLQAGADPRIESDLGMNAFAYCERYGPFPDIMDALRMSAKK